MTKNEAIQILKPFRDCMVDQHGCPISDVVYALDVAIKALEDKTDLQPTCNNLATNLQVDTPTEKVDAPTDLIRRQAAIDALEWKWAGKSAIDAIKNLPSAQPVTVTETTLYEDGTLWVTVENCQEVGRVIVDEYNEQFCRTFYMDETRWIPVTERLPEDTGEYLVWMLWDFDEYPTHSIIHYDADVGKFGEWHEYFDRITLGSLGSEFRSIDSVIAWCNLPEPYKGVE